MEMATRPDADPFAAILEGCLAALAAETDAVRDSLATRGLARPLVAVDGRLRDEAGTGFAYEWRLADDSADVRVDDAVQVRCQAGESSGFVIRFDRTRRQVAVATQEWLGTLPGAAELEFDPTWLLAALTARLERIDRHPDHYHRDTALQLFGRRFPETGELAPERHSSLELNSGQRAALSRSLGSEVQFVWGPPGTGKTRLLGELVAELAERRRVLVTAMTNGAIDEAAERIAESLGDGAIRDNRVVRVGAEFSVTGNPTLALGAAVERRVASGAAGISESLAALERELLRRGAAATRAAPTRARHARLLAVARARGAEEALAELQQIGSELQRQSVFALRDADVVISTLARVALWDDLASLRFHATVIEEASTAPLPYVLLAASMTSRHVYPVGDFQQLPAVVVSDSEAARRWLSRDIFHEAGVVPEAGPEGTALPADGDLLCAMLVEQYRMAPSIRSLVSDLFYDGRLTDADSVRTRPAPRAPLILLDTSGRQAVTEREEGSRANPVHAETIARFLELAVAEGVEEIAVVVPYRLQARRIRELVRRRLGRSAPPGLEVSTIHRFQGREKSVVVIDTVDAPPARSWFLNETLNGDFPQLLNVALSRARDMLVVVASRQGLLRTLPQTALLNRAIERIAESGTVVDAAGVADARWLFEDRDLATPSSGETAVLGAGDPLGD